MDAKGRLGETQIGLEVREHLVEDGVLVVEVGHVGDDEVEIDVLPSWFADGVVLDSLRLVVQKLETAGCAATNGEFNMQLDRGLAGAVVEGVFVAVGHDGRFVASWAQRVEVGGCG